MEQIVKVELRLGRLAYYQITGLGIISVIGGLLLFLPIYETYNNNFIDRSIVQKVDASLGPIEINHLYSLEEKAGDAQLPFSFLSVHEDFIDTERNCEFCILVKYIPGPEGAAGIAFKNDNGIELSIPIELYRDPDVVEFINNPDGTTSVMIKNIEKIKNLF